MTYGCEIWPLTNKMKLSLTTFDNKTLRKICGPIFDAKRSN